MEASGVGAIPSVRTAIELTNVDGGRSGGRRMNSDDPRYHKDSGVESRRITARLEQRTRTRHQYTAHDAVMMVVGSVHRDKPLRCLGVPLAVVDWEPRLNTAGWRCSGFWHYEGIDIVSVHCIE